MYIFTNHSLRIVQRTRASNWIFNVFLKQNDCFLLKLECLFVSLGFSFSLFDCFRKLRIFLITSSTGLVSVSPMDLGWTEAPPEPRRAGRCWSQSWSFQLLARAGAELQASYTGLARPLANIKSHHFSPFLPFLPSWRWGERVMEPTLVAPTATMAK